MPPRSPMPRKLLEPLAMEIERMLRAAEAWDTARGIEDVGGPVSLEPEAFGHWERRIGECAERLEKAGYAPQAEQLRAYRPSRDPDEALDIDGIFEWLQEQRKDSAPEREDGRSGRGKAQDGKAGGKAQAPVEPPANPTNDPSAYVPAKDLWPDRFRTYKRFKSFLDSTPEIRRESPSPRRLVVHAGDWHRYWAEHEARVGESLGELNAGTVDEYLDDQAARQAAIRQTKRRK